MVGHPTGANLAVLDDRAVTPEFPWSRLLIMDRTSRGAFAQPRSRTLPRSTGIDHPLPQRFIAIPQESDKGRPDPHVTDTVPRSAL